MMLYAFGDESYPKGERVATYVVVTSLQDLFRAKASELRSVFSNNGAGKARQRKLLESLLGLEASVVLGHAEIPKNFDSLGAIRASEIGTIAPMAALWSWLFGFTCSAALHDAVNSGIVFSCVDFFYERNDLSELHKEVTHEVMRNTIPIHLAELLAVRLRSHATLPTLRRITPVPKWPEPFSPQHVQLGVSCAHEVQTFAWRSRAEAEALGVKFRDFSDTIEGRLKTGKPEAGP